MECKDRATGVYYPRHEEYTGRGYCVRCGETTDADLHAAYRRVVAGQAEERRRLEEADRLFAAGRIDPGDHIRRTARR